MFQNMFGCQGLFTKRGDWLKLHAHSSGEAFFDQILFRIGYSVWSQVDPTKCEDDIFTCWLGGRNLHDTT